LLIIDRGMLVARGAVAVLTKAASQAPRGDGGPDHWEVRGLDEMTTSWAYIYGQPGADPAADRFVIERDGQRTTLVPVPDESVAAQVAVELVDGGVELIELCGGFSMAQAAQVVEAVGGRVPVGWVTFGFESIIGAAAYKPRYETQYAAQTM
jgi:uncharacterized protein DUF6506